MSNTDFYEQFNKIIPSVRSGALKLTKDFDKSRFLFHETAHQAYKHKKQLSSEKLLEWTISTMKKIYHKQTHLELIS